MTTEPARRAHAIFSRAMELDGQERAALVREACAGDVDLLERVGRLLRAAERSGDFMESPAISSHLDPAPPEPDAVGTYVVVGVLGSGGMATVYEAVQENPCRRVALKVLHRSMTHSDALLRFRMEAQTLARLHHPGIAQIYEAGTARLGQPTPSPFFAMELVPDALSITHYADKHGLSLHERLEMFVDVCDAVLHGHQNGIMHRDIKPANVLVGADGIVKVIDFGIARTIGTDGPAITSVNDAKQIIGTLNYMSPEQCLDPASVDVRSDVYSLGVLLYELVTGVLPHDLSARSIPEAVRVIAEDHPVRAGARRREAAGDLEAIISVAMAKERERRYMGAGALAADVRRFLNHELIQARPASIGDRVSKFARRNPHLVAASAVAVAMLLAGTAVSARFAYKASHARDAALQRERDLEVITQFQESMLRSLDVPAMGDRLRAGIREGLERGGDATGLGAESDVAAWNRLADRLNFTSLAVDVLHESILQGYAASINSRFAAQPVLRARMLQQLAGTMNELGLYQEALPIITEALELRETHLGGDHGDTLQSRHAIGSLLARLGRFDEALAHLVAAYEARRRRFGPDSDEALATGITLGGLYRRMGNLPEAERVWNDTLTRQRRVLGDDDPSTLRMLNNIGVLYAVQGRSDEAEAVWRELLERRLATLGPDHLDFLGTLANLGQLLQDQGRYAEAEPLLRQTLAAERAQLGDRHDATLTTMSMLASLLRVTGRLDEALVLQRECHEGRLAVFGPDHTDTVVAQARLGMILHASGDREQGERLVRQASEAHLRLLGESHPAAVESMAALRDIEIEASRLEAAQALSARIVELSRSGVVREPFLVGEHVSIHGVVLFRLGLSKPAADHLHEGYDTLARSVGPSHPSTRAAAARLAEYYADVLTRSGGEASRAEHEKWLKQSDF